MKRVTIHTDGSAWPNPGPGGWAAVLQFDDGRRHELSGRSEGDTTNNRMELTAAIEALHYLLEPHSVTLVTDSQYVCYGARNWMFTWHRWDWTRKAKGGRDCRVDVINADLWREIWRLCGIHNVIWEWVRGHSECVENNRADELAGKRP